MPEERQDAPAADRRHSASDWSILRSWSRTSTRIRWISNGVAEVISSSCCRRRPITTAIHPDPWNDSRSGDFLWTNTNVGEAIPDVMTPATWSMVQVFLTDAMATASIPPYVGYGRIGGRIYLNLSVMMTLVRGSGRQREALSQPERGSLRKTS